MVDFNKLLSTRNLQKPIDPIEIYKSLDRTREKGELRSAQEIILKEWYSKYNNKKDSIIKLNTGKRKTLIGLLILQSKLNKNEEPCLYLCPNKFLVEQTCKEAESFGIEVCTAEKDIPIEFENGKKFLLQL